MFANDINMDAIVHFETFLLAGLLLNITPGNDTIFILSKSIGQGRKAGMISALGIGAGCVIHTIMATFGLSLIISQSMILFNVIKYAGVLYLFYMGYKMLIERETFNAGSIEPGSVVDYQKIFRDAMVTNVLNPKVALFFIAFLPQFVDPSAQNTVLPFLVLGSTFITTGTLWCLFLAAFAASIFERLKNDRRTASIINKVCGLTLIGLGIKVALSKR
jgi:RhtB (resistance to homoserine/threonine) family protein